MRIDLNDLTKLKNLDNGLENINISQTSGGFISLLKGNGLTPYQGSVEFDDPESADKTFSPHYDQHIKPFVQKFEDKRISSLKKVRKWSLRLIPVAIIATIAAIGICLKADLGETGLKFLGALWILMMLIIVGVIYTPIHLYKSDVKGVIFPKVFSFFGDYTYLPKGGLSITSLKSSDIIPSYDREKTEDYVKGEYKGVSLELTEAHLEDKRRNSKGNTYYVTIFKGIFVCLSMNKNFSGKTIIKKDSGVIGNWFTDKFNGLDKVSLEDPVFEKMFEVYSDDQIEARYLLTTSFMERLLKLSELLGGKGVQASFYDDKFLMMIPSGKDRFETSSIFIPATFEEDINTILAEMNEIFQIVDILKLNQKIGL